MSGLAAVACSAGHGYAGRVSRLHFHRWAVVFLLMSKLILGELTHAMPHMDMNRAATATNEMVASASDASASDASTSHESPPCGSHAQSGSETGQSQDSSSDDSAAMSCCQGGECACPCLHSPAAAAAGSLTVQPAHDGQTGVLIEGAAWHRWSGLFRPPA